MIKQSSKKESSPIERLNLQSARDYSVAFSPALSKSEATRLSIIEAAIECYALSGAELITFDHIAKECGVSRTLVVRYFPDQRQLLLIAAQYIRAGLQRLSVSAMENQHSATDKLKAYVDSTFDWLETKPNHCRFWLLFYYYCGIDTKFKGLNTMLVLAGTDRIASLIELGIRHKEFRASVHPLTAASVIQNLITGSLLTVLTGGTKLPAERFQKIVRDHCLNLLT